MALFLAEFSIDDRPRTVPAGRSCPTLLCGRIPSQPVTLGAPNPDLSPSTWPGSRSRSWVLTDIPAPPRCRRALLGSTVSPASAFATACLRKRRRPEPVWVGEPERRRRSNHHTKDHLVVAGLPENSFDPRGRYQRIRDIIRAMRLNIRFRQEIHVTKEKFGTQKSRTRPNRSPSCLLSPFH
jgi:hypothetical protein